MKTEEQGEIVQDSERDEHIFKHACDFALQIWNDNGEVHPMYIGYGPEHAYVLPAIFNGKTMAEVNQQKNKFAAIAKLLFMRYQVDHFVGIMEAWSYRAESKEEMDKMHAEHGGSLEFVPGRQEILSVFSVNHRRQKTNVWEIVRDPDKPARLVKQDGGFDKMSGRLIELLPPPGKKLTEEQNRITDLILEMAGYQIDKINVEGMPKPTFH